jgi:hypothetical protein
MATKNNSMLSWNLKTSKHVIKLLKLSVYFYNPVHTPSFLNISNAITTAKFEEIPVEENAIVDDDDFAITSLSKMFC